MRFHLEIWPEEDKEALDEVIDGTLPPAWLLDRLPHRTPAAILRQLLRRSRGCAIPGVECPDDARRRWVGEIGCEALLRAQRRAGFAP